MSARESLEFILVCLFVIIALLLRSIKKLYQFRKSQLDEINKNIKEKYKILENFEIAKRTELDKLRIDSNSNIENQRVEFEKWKESERIAIEHKHDELEVRSKLLLDSYSKKLKSLDELAKEKSKGFPFLANAYADYFELVDSELAQILQSKKRPAIKASEQIKEISKKRIKAERLWRVLNYQIQLYEHYFPWLSEYRDDCADDALLGYKNEGDTGSDTQEDKDEDPVIHWVPKSEYASLSTVERNQKALDRFVSSRKTKWEIGRDYERYIGYIYEKSGCDVSYYGIMKGYEDLGRDIIAVKESTVHIIQCKYWSKEKEIHEKHIFQLFGTSIAYQIEHPEFKKINITFYTSANLSDRAKQFANHLNIEVRENFPMEKYPIIKCNVSKRTGEKIYHLPFDQQYDKTKMHEYEGKLWVETVAEAERLGFRRAYRWTGSLAKE